jgi:hypothetical protein
MPFCAAGGRNNPAFVVQTDPNLLKRLSIMVLDMHDGSPCVRQRLCDVLVDPDAGIGDISETFPGAKELKPVAGTKKKDKEHNALVAETISQLRKWKEHVKLISQVLAMQKASPESACHPEEVMLIDFWLADMVRMREGHIPPPREGYRRTIPENLTDVSKEARVFPAPLKAYPPNVFTGVTPATLRLYAGRPLPRIQRSESEVQPLLEEAYSDKL